MPEKIFKKIEDFLKLHNILKGKKYYELLGRIAELIVHDDYASYRKKMNPSIELSNFWFSDTNMGANDWREYSLLKGTEQKKMLRDFLVKSGGNSEKIDAAFRGQNKIVEKNDPKMPDMMTIINSGINSGLRELYEIKPATHFMGRESKPHISQGNKAEFNQKYNQIYLITADANMEPIIGGIKYKVREGKPDKQYFEAVDLIEDVMIEDVMIQKSKLRQFFANVPDDVFDIIADKLDNIVKNNIKPILSMVKVPYKFELHIANYESGQMKPGLIFYRIIVEKTESDEQPDWWLLLLAAYGLTFQVLDETPQDIKDRVKDIKNSIEINPDIINAMAFLGAICLFVFLFLLSTLEFSGLAILSLFFLFASTSNAVEEKKILGGTVGGGGKRECSNNTRDVAYSQILLNNYLSSKGGDRLLVTGIMDSKTEAAIKRFNKEECNSDSNRIDTSGEPLIKLHTNFMTNMVFGSSFSDTFSILNSLDTKAVETYLLENDELRILCKSISAYGFEFFKLLYETLPSVDKDSAPESSLMVRKWGKTRNAKRLLEELNDLTSATPVPGDEAGLYAALEEKASKQNEEIDKIFEFLTPPDQEPKQPLPFKRRNKWGGSPDWPDMSKVVHCDWNYTTVVLHNFDNGYKNTPEKIKDFDLKQDGYADIGCHFIIDREGIIYEARSLLFLGAHVVDKPTNTGRIGVVVCGDFQHQWWDLSDDDVDPKQIVALEKLLNALKSTFGEGDGKLKFLMTHRDYKSGACPGDKLLGHLDDLRGKTGLTKE